MSKLDNYIYHKIALSTYNLYENYTSNAKSKEIVMYGYGFNGFCESISITMKNRVIVAIPDKKTEMFINNLMSKLMSDVEDIYGIKDSSVGVMVFDFFHDDIWREWAPIITNTKRYFGV